jgi:hypothetical protein
MLASIPATIDVALLTMCEPPYEEAKPTMRDQQHHSLPGRTVRRRRFGYRRGCLIWTTLPALTMPGLFVVGPSALLHVWTDIRAEHAAITSAFPSDSFGHGCW